MRRRLRMTRMMRMTRMRRVMRMQMRRRRSLRCEKLRQRIVSAALRRASGRTRARRRRQRRRTRRRRMRRRTRRRRMRRVCGQTQDARPPEKRAWPQQTRHLLRHRTPMRSQALRGHMHRQTAYRHAHHMETELQGDPRWAPVTAPTRILLQICFWSFGKAQQQWCADRVRLPRAVLLRWRRRRRRRKWRRSQEESRAVLMTMMRLRIDRAVWVCSPRRLCPAASVPFSRPLPLCLPALWQSTAHPPPPSAGCLCRKEAWSGGVDASRQAQHVKGPQS